MITKEKKKETNVATTKQEHEFDMLLLKIYCMGNNCLWTAECISYNPSYHLY